MLQYLRVDYYNPFTQFTLKLTSPMVVPVRRIVPGYGGIDYATLIVLYLTVFVKVLLLSFIAWHKFPNIFGLLIWAIGDLASILFVFYFYAILALVISSWIAPFSRTPFLVLLYQITDPIMRPARRWIKPIAGFDVSPIFVIIVLNLCSLLIAHPIELVGMNLALR